MSKPETIRHRDNLVLFGYCGLDDEYQKSLRNSFNVDDIRNRFGGLIDIFDIEYFDPVSKDIADLRVFIGKKLQKYADDYQNKAGYWNALHTTNNLIYSLRRNYKKVFWGLSQPVYDFVNKNEGKKVFSPYIDYSYIYRMVAPTTESAVNIILSLFKDKFQIVLPTSKD